jgi:gamma-glutamyltranspeptidase/glutathione hydrolase
MRSLRARSTLLFGALALACAAPKDFDEAAVWPTPARGMVVTEHPLATEVGLEVLDAGGNAADAAVAAALALAVVYPQAGNLGGGGFALWVPHQGKPRALDFRETAPAALTSEAFLDGDGAVDRQLAMASGLAAGVPGSPAGLWELHQWAGSLPLAEVVAPAIRLAGEGFAVDPWLAEKLGEEPFASRLQASPAAAAVFYPGGRPLAEGDLLVQPELAGTLQRFADGGLPGFYEGPTADALIAEVERAGGVMSDEDLLDYDVVERRPLSAWFRGSEVVTMPPPSSGGIVLLQVLRILDGFPMNADRDQARARAETTLGAGPGISDRSLHWWIEAMRASFADRAEHLGDPDHVDVPTDGLLSQAWVNRRRMGIGERANPGVKPWVPPGPEEGPETTHLCVLDAAGNAVSMTTTINYTFGSGILVEGAGFLLNNEMDDFAILAGAPNVYGLVGSDANAIAPGKRPLSSMTPAVVRDQGGVVQLVIGSPGGPRIITSVIQVMLRLLVYEQELTAAIRAPRLHQQWKLGGGGIPERTVFEPGWPPEVLEDLRRRGHAVEESEDRWASVQAIRVEIGGEPEGFSDPRRGGAAGAQDQPVDQPARPELPYEQRPGARPRPRRAPHRRRRRAA